MGERTPEFSRLVLAARLGLEPHQQTIEATIEERERLARRFELISLDRLSAVAIVQRREGGLIRLEAHFEAEFQQTCVVTLDPVPGRLSEAFSLVYGPPRDEDQEIEIDIEEPVYEPLAGDAIDIGEAVSQELSLLLPEFPRQADAVIEPVAADDDPLSGSFDTLARLRRPSQD